MNFKNFQVFFIWDHFLGSQDLALCVVCGLVHEETDEKVVLKHWALLNPKNKALLNDEDNDECLTIIKSTIEDRFYSPAKSWQRVKD